jgi:ribosomal protein L7/L12
METLLYVVIGLQVMLLVLLWSTNARLGRMESRLEMKMVEVPVVMPAAVSSSAQPTQGMDMSQVQVLLMNGNKIGAIKAYRELTDVGLKEAKDAVEALELQMKGYPR